MSEEWPKNQAILFEAVLDELKPVLLENIQPISEQHGQEYLDYLLEGKSRKAFKRPALNHYQEYIFELFHALSEISHSLETLKLSEKFLSQFPSGRSNVTKKEYLQFHYETYLQNSYILKERLILLPNKFLKKHNLIEKEDAKDMVCEIKNVYEKLFHNLRKQHVHFYKVETATLERLGTFELLTKFKSDDDEFFNVMEHFRYTTSYKAKEELRTYVKKLNDNFFNYLDSYFLKINQICLKNGKVIAPKLASGKTNSF